MARAFDDAASERLDVAFAPSFATTFACWFNTDLANSVQYLMGATQGASTDVSTNTFGLRTSGSNKIQAWTESQVAQTVEYTVGVWNHACAVHAASNDRRAYLNGGNKATSTNDRGVSSIDLFTIGALGLATPTAFMSGSIAEAAVWDVALTDAEVAILGLGYSPLMVRPQNLTFYVPLIRDDDNDLGINLGETTE